MINALVPVGMASFSWIFLVSIGTTYYPLFPLSLVARSSRAGSAFYGIIPVLNPLYMGDLLYKRTIGILGSAFQSDILKYKTLAYQLLFCKPISVFLQGMFLFFFGYGYDFIIILC